MARPMDDLVVLVPGILGSVLKKDGEVVWGFPRGLYRGKKNELRKWAQMLHLEKDDPKAEFLDDGIQATTLISMPQLVAGFWKTDGYDTLRERLLTEYQLEKDHSDVPGNYLEFAYDWRRDNQASARRLRSTVKDQLDRIEKFMGTRPKVIFICHSMGGLVAKYYLEMLDGWHDCRALITLGTPFSGSVASLDSISNGHSISGVDFSSTLRSCTSVYQLLPTYDVLDLGSGDFHRLVAPMCKSLVPNLDNARLEEAELFHKELRDSASERVGKLIYAFVGDSVKSTYQSATLSNGKLKPSNWVPDNWPPHRGTGDGTVPQVSAIPHELRKNPLGIFYDSAQHAMLQSSENIWRQLRRILNLLQDRKIGDVQSPLDASLAGELDAPSFQIVEAPNVIAQGKTAALAVRIENAPIGFDSIEAKLTSVEGDEVKTYGFESAVDGKWKLELGVLPGGIYRYEVYSPSGEIQAAVSDVFEVAAIEE